MILDNIFLHDLRDCEMKTRQLRFFKVENIFPESPSHKVERESLRGQKQLQIKALQLATKNEINKSNH